MGNHFKSFLKKKMLKYNTFFKVINLAIPQYKKFKVMELYSYCVEHGEIIELIDDSMHGKGCKLVSAANEFYSFSKVEYEDRIISRKYISKISNVIILAETDGFIKNTQFLTDRILWNKAGFDDFLTDNIRASDSNFCVIKNNWNNTVVLPRGICLAKMGSYNYFHFTFEVLARLNDMETLEQYKDWPLLVDAVVKRDPRSLELLNLFKGNTREIIWLERNVAYQLEEVIVPAYYAWVPYLEPAHPYIIDKASIKYIRETVRQKLSIYETAKKVYIARGNNKRLVNETELIKVLRANGYEIFNPDEGNLTDEISYFAGADIIVGCYGAAFTNVIYCKPTVSVMVICPFELQIASGLNLLDAAEISNVEMIPCKMVTEGEIVHLSAFEITNEGIDKILKLSCGEGW